MDKKHDFQKVEMELERMWEENYIYKYQNGKYRKVFSIDTPPPTVSEMGEYDRIYILYV
jgi:valyl-tRNA synthetase